MKLPPQLAELKTELCLCGLFLFEYTLCGCPRLAPENLPASKVLSRMAEFPASKRKFIFNLEQ